AIVSAFTEYLHETWLCKRSSQLSRAQFWNAIDEGAYDIANILAPYEDTEATGLPATLFHIIKTPKANMLRKLHFLFNLGPQYSKYICDTMKGFNALHAVVESSGS